MTRRTVVACVAIGLALALGGCAVSRGTTGASVASAASAAASRATATARAIDTLRAGIAFTEHTSFVATADIADGGLTYVAHVDNPHLRLESTFSTHDSSSGTWVREIRLIGKELYVRDSRTGAGWWTLEPARILDQLSTFLPGPDPVESIRLINAIASAEASGSKVSGTLDLAKVGIGEYGISMRPGPSGFPDAAHYQPFSAELDGQGRLVSFVIPAAHGFPDSALRYSAIGAAVVVSRPQNARPAPESVYTQLGFH